MKKVSALECLNHVLLWAVRDDQLSVAEFVARFGEESFHLLRKEGAIVVEGERVRLSRRCLSPDGPRFVWGNRRFHLDDNVVEVVRWGPGGPPTYSEEP